MAVDVSEQLLGELTLLEAPLAQEAPLELEAELKLCARSLPDSTDTALVTPPDCSTDTALVTSSTVSGGVTLSAMRREIGVVTSLFGDLVGDLVGDLIDNLAGDLVGDG